jgi:tetratricopeptide (TPR) repeat protein
MLGWYLRQTMPGVLFGLVWFVLFLLPSTALFILGRGEALAEHRVYLSSVGVFLAGAVVLETVLSRPGRQSPVFRWALTGVIAVVVLQLGVRTMLRNAVWSNPVGLWTEAVEQAPTHWLPRLMLGETLRNQSGCAEAIPEYQNAITFAPEETFAYTKLGGCLIEQKRYDEAERVYVTLRETAPTSAEGPLGLAIVAMLKDQPKYSEAYLREALVRDPSAIQPRQLLATIEESRDPAAALRLCREIRELAPDTPGNEDCLRRNERRVVDK